MMWAKILLALLLFLWRNGVRKLVYINNDMFNQTYRRSNAGDYKCTRLQVKAILRDQTENTMDMEILDDAEYLRSIGAAATSREDKQLHPTAAGMLMFGDEFNIVRHFPEYFLDYREMLDPTIRWTDRLQFSSGEWSGNIYDFYFRVYNSDPRNKALMKMFNLINIGERAGSGVPNIFNVWEDEGWVEPVIEERFDPDRTILTLEFKKKSGDKKATKKLRHSMIKYLALWSLTKSIVCRNFVNYLI